MRWSFDFRWPEQIVLAILLALIILTPLAFGSVHPWAYSTSEVGISFLAVAWAAKLWLGNDVRSPQGGDGLVGLRSIVAPLGLFVGLVLFELFPIPPSVLSRLSPATYRLYAESLPGWPKAAPYADLASIPRAPSHSTGPASDEKSAKPPAAAWTAPRFVSQFSEKLLSSPWRSLAIAPSLTWSGFLCLVACVFLFALLLSYPFSPLHDSAFFPFRFIVAAIVLTGLLVAVIGLLERSFWNGKILWFFVPLDWGAPLAPTAPRAMGPFVNPDHFAAYLTMIFPLTIASALFPMRSTRGKSSASLRALSALSALVIFAGVLLSLSRSGWVGLTAGTCLFFVLASGQFNKLALRLPRPFRVGPIWYSFAALSVVLAFALLLVGPEAGTGVGARLAQTAGQGHDLAGRLPAWKDGIWIVRDFPLFGIGFGGWPSIFSRYQSPPRTSFYLRQPHNDYLELMTDTGLIGFGLLILFIYRVAVVLRRGIASVDSETLPLLAALTSGVVAIAIEEIFDFDLQIPANAFLLTILLGLSLRLAAKKNEPEPQATSLPRVRVTAVCAGTGAFALLSGVLSQGSVPYPYDLKAPGTLPAARALLLTYPSEWYSHLAFAVLLDDCSARRLQELHISLWLDPTNAAARDLYAKDLSCAGRKPEALEQIRLSVLFSPDPATHGYLAAQSIPSLPAAEKNAIELGFKQAVARGYDGAVSGLGQFYNAQSRFADEGSLLVNAAQSEPEEQKRTDYLLAAGTAFARAKQLNAAESALRKAAQNTRDDPRPYEDLITLVLAPRNDLGQAEQIISQAAEQGTDPYPLWMALAQAAQSNGNPMMAESSLVAALSIRPDLDTALRIGQFCLDSRNFEKAALYMRKATQIDPSSAQAFYYLGAAEEGAFNYPQADKAYARAVALAPGTEDFRSRYQEFRSRVRASGETGRAVK